MGWPSTAHYYSCMNRIAVSDNQSFHMIVNSLPFDQVRQVAEKQGFSAVGELLSEEAMRLEDAGADIILLCAVTAHLVHNQVSSAVKVPVPSICAAVKEKLYELDQWPAGLLGTRDSLVGDVFKLSDNESFSTIIPPRHILDELDGAIKNNIAFGNIGNREKEVLEEAIKNLEASGARTIVLACTELPIVSRTESASVPVIDAVEAHCQSAINHILKNPHGKTN